jgi:hypothetical protein
LGHQGHVTAIFHHVPLQHVQTYHSISFVTGLIDIL